MIPFTISTSKKEIVSCKNYKMRLNKSCDPNTLTISDSEHILLTIKNDDKFIVQHLITVHKPSADLPFAVCSKFCDDGNWEYGRYFYDSKTNSLVCDMIYKTESELNSFSPAEHSANYIFIGASALFIIMLIIFIVISL
jgi:hypothetical protein